MKITEEILERIDRYINNTLPLEEKNEFEKLLRDNKEVNEAYQISLDLEKVLVDNKRSEIIHLTNNLSDEFGDQYEQNEKNPKQKHTFSFSKVFIIILIGLALCILLYILKSFTFSNETKYASYYESYTISTIERSTIDEKKTIDFLLDSLIESKNYQDLLDVIKAEKESSIVQEDKIRFYEGISYLELDDFNKSKEALMLVTQLKETPYNQASLWYLALISLKENDLDKTKSYLETLTKNYTKGKYYQQANKLLSEIP